MKRKMLLSIAIIVMFVMVLYAPATINAITPDNNSIIQETPVVCKVHSDLIIRSTNISSNVFGTVNSVDTGYFNVTNIYYYNYHTLEHDITCNVVGKVTGHTGGSTIITHQFEYVITATNATGTFKEYNGYVVMKNIGFGWYGPYTHNYVAMSVNAEIYQNGDVFMQYSVAYSKTPSTAYVALMDITNSVKHVLC